MRRRPGRRFLGTMTTACLGAALLLITSWTGSVHAEDEAPATITVRGRVLDSAGAPLPGLRVEARLSRSKNQAGQPLDGRQARLPSDPPEAHLRSALLAHVRTGVTNDDGQFEIQDVDPRVYATLDIAPGQSHTHRRSTQALPLGEALIQAVPARHVTLHIDAPPTLPSVDLLRLGSHPGSGMAIDRWIRVADGRAEITVPNMQAPWQLDLLAPGVGFVRRVPLILTEEDSIRLALPTGRGRIVTRALDSEGRPIPSATVDAFFHVPVAEDSEKKARSYWHLRTRCDAGGRALFEGLPESATITRLEAHAEGHAPCYEGSLTVRTETEAPTTHDLRLGPACTLTVAVKGIDGRPIPDTDVSVRRWLGQPRRTHTWNGTTNSQGQITFNDLPEGIVLVHAWADRRFQAGSSERPRSGSPGGRAGFESMMLSPGSQSKRVLLYRGNLVTGEVQSADGAPLAHLPLTLVATAGRHWTASMSISKHAWSVVTDAEGRFTCAGIPPQLTLAPHVNANNITVPRTSYDVATFGYPTHMVMRAIRERTVRVTMLGPTGEIALPAQVRIEDDEGATLGQGQADVAQPARFVVPASKRLHVVNSYDPLRKHVHVVEPGREDADVSLKLPPGLRTLTITVVDKSGEPLPSVPLVLTPKDRAVLAHARTVTTNERGRAVFAHVPRIPFHVRHKGRTFSAELSAEEADKALQVTRPPSRRMRETPKALPWRTINARVLLADGSPLARGVLRIQSEPDAEASARRRKTEASRVFSGFTRIRTQLVEGATVRVFVSDPTTPLLEPVNVTLGHHVLTLPSSTCTLTLKAGRMIEGRVVDEDGQPVAEMPVMAFVDRRSGGPPWRAVTTRSGRDGTFSIARVAEDRKVYVAVLPRAPLSADPPKLAPETREPVELLVRRSVAQRLKLVDSQGHPLGQVRVSLREVEAMDAPRAPGRRRSPSALTDETNAEGVVVFEGLHPALSYATEVPARSSSGVQFAAIRREIGTPRPGTVALLQRRILRPVFYLKTSRGVPIRGGGLYLRPWFYEDDDPRGQHYVSSTPDHEGRVAFSKIPEGDYAAWTAGGREKSAQRVRVESEEPITFTAPKGISGRFGVQVGGTLRVPEGSRVHGVTIYARNGEGEVTGHRATLTTGAGGEPWRFATSVDDSGGAAITVVVRGTDREGNQLGAIQTAEHLVNPALHLRLAPSLRVRVRYVGLPSQLPSHRLQLSLRSGLYTVNLSGSREVWLPPGSYTPDLGNAKERLRGRLLFPVPFDLNSGELVLRYEHPAPPGATEDE